MDGFLLLERVLLEGVLLVLLVADVHVLVVEPVLGLPGHLVLLLQPPPGVREPTTHLINQSINKCLKSLYNPSI